ncbi:hypothetical protein LFAB_04080 [Lactiplantibacillus fabifermentans T30PCM01]|uniref:Uncharacterized protein n=1 Tax=Lactiplantibacillus fabifermentans T30PCM01 TaxID=1400520 RepID=W6T9A1_9LACO|nr:hypothetical protein LFAB_04080 [Lactiplantibacillus fabifermentans T30PCM01]
MITLKKLLQVITELHINKWLLTNQSQSVGSTLPLRYDDAESTKWGYQKKSRRAELVTGA